MGETNKSGTAKGIAVVTAVAGLVAACFAVGAKYYEFRKAKAVAQDTPAPASPVPSVDTVPKTDPPKTNPPKTDDKVDARKSEPTKPKTDDAWKKRFRPGHYAVAYTLAKATTTLSDDGTFQWVRHDGDIRKGWIESRGDELVLRCDNPKGFVEVWAAGKDGISVRHWWPVAAYPKGEASSYGRASKK